MKVERGINGELSSLQNDSTKNTKMEIPERFTRPSASSSAPRRKLRIDNAEISAKKMEIPQLPSIMLDSPDEVRNSEKPTQRITRSKTAGQIYSTDKHSLKSSSSRSNVKHANLDEIGSITREVKKLQFANTADKLSLICYNED